MGGGILRITGLNGGVKDQNIHQAGDGNREDDDEKGEYVGHVGVLEECRDQIAH